MDPSDAILRFLDSVGRRSEAEFYLNLFRAESKESFATLVVEPAVLRHALDAVFLNLRFLHGLGLVPVVSLGLYRPGPYAGDNAERLARRLARVDVPAVIHPAGPRNLAALVTKSARAGQIPIVPYLTGDAGDVAIRFEALGQLADALKTRKIIFLARRGGLRLRGSDSDVPIVNLATDYDAMVASRGLTPKQLFLLAYARHLIVDLVAHRMLVSVTSPLSLLRDLFTVKGAGTLIKRGTKIAVFNSFAEVDRERLDGLLVSSFSRTLRDGFFSRDVSRIYLEENYRGAALVRETPLGAYLCKFAVDREAQGEGMGRDLWQLVTNDHPTLFWRARPGNAITSFYLQQCDGMARFADWHVYWKGMPNERIADAISYALSAPVDFAS